MNVTSGPDRGGTDPLPCFTQQALGLLRADDGDLYSLLRREYERQWYSLDMLAASIAADPSVLAAKGLVLSN